RTEGGEISKTRPAIVMSNDRANTVLNRVIVVPLTTNVQELYPGEVFVTAAGRQSKAMSDQIRAIGKVRLRGKLDALSAEDLMSVEKAVLLQLGLLIEGE